MQGVHANGPDNGGACGWVIKIGSESAAILLIHTEMEPGGAGREFPGSPEPRVRQGLGGRPAREG